jgi:hypothetical protein
MPPTRLSALHASQSARFEAGLVAGWIKDACGLAAVVLFAVALAVVLP